MCVLENLPDRVERGKFKLQRKIRRKNKCMDYREMKFNWEWEIWLKMSY